MKKIILMLIFTFGFAGGNTNAQKGPPSPEALKNYDKAYEEYLKKLAEVQEKNKIIAENNQKINQALTDGVKAFGEKKYQLAAEKFDEGYRLDPDFWGSAPVLLNNKAMALRNLGIEKYNKAIKSNLNPAAEANQYLLQAISALKESQIILASAPETIDENQKKTIETTLYLAVSQLIECYKLLLLTDKTRVYEAIEAFENYIKIEPQEYKKQKAEETLKQIKIQFKIDY